MAINPFVGMSKIEKVNLGRRRILSCLAHLEKGGCAWVNLQDLQKLYLSVFERELNREEYRCLFGIHQATSVFQKFMADDINLTTNSKKTGSLYMHLKRTLKEAIGEECPVELLKCAAVTEGKGKVVTKKQANGMSKSAPSASIKSAKPAYFKLESSVKEEGGEKKPIPAFILVPFLLDGIPAIKPVGTLKELLKTVPVYSLSVLKSAKGSGPSSAKGNGKMAASSTAQKFPLSKMVKARKKYLNDENQKESGGFECEYAPSKEPYEPKSSAKAVTVSNIVKSKQADDDVLYTDTENGDDDINEDEDSNEDEEEEEGKFKLAAKMVQIMKKQPDDMEEGDEKKNKVYNLWDSDEEEEDKALAQKNDCPLKNNAAKMAADEAEVVEKAEKQLAMAACSTSHQGGPSSAIDTHCNVEYFIRRAIQSQTARRRRVAINEMKGADEEEEEGNEIGLEEKQPNGPKVLKQPAVVVTKMTRRLAAMPEEDGTNSSKAVGKSVGNKTQPKPPVAGNGKWTIPAECVMNSGSDEEEEKVEGNGAFSFDEAPSEDEVEEEEVEEVEKEADNNGERESTKNLVENAAGEGEMAVKLVGIDNKAELMNGNGQMPTAAAARAKQQESSAMPEAFKRQMLAIITLAVKRKGIYVASELDAELAAECYAAEYSAHFPSVDALVKFVRQNCNFVKVHANKFFLLDDTQLDFLDLDRLLQKVGKSLQAAAANK